MADDSTKAEEEAEGSYTYSEEADFAEHRGHIETMDAVLHNISIQEDSRVLDVGGGQGMHACFLAARFRECWCLDIIDYQSLYNGEYYRLFKEKCERNDVHYNRSQLRFIECDAMNILFRNDYFDFVTSFNAFEHIPDPSLALAEILRVTKPGGIVYLTFDPLWTADSGSHFIHRVPEPWAHLLLPDDEFIALMKKSGADDSELLEYRHAMNRLRLEDYRRIFATLKSNSNLEILHESSWSGLCQKSYRKHRNYEKCLSKGFTKEELEIRGMRYIIRKGH